MSTKILIVGSQSIDKLELAKQLVSANSDLTISPIFTSELTYKDNDTEYFYYKDNLDISMDYKNNALFFIVSNELMSYGITVDDYDKNNVFVLNLSDFNSISDKNLKLYDNLIIWLDTKYSYENSKDFKETKFLLERLNKFNYLYFLNEDNDHIVDIVTRYLTTDSIDEKNRIKEENS